MDTYLPSRVLEMRVVSWTRRERPADINISYLERKDTCKTSNELKMEKSMQLSCEGEEDASSLPGQGWACCMSLSHYASVIRWDTYVYFLSFEDPAHNQAPISLKRQGTGSN